MNTKLYLFCGLFMPLISMSQSASTNTSFGDSALRNVVFGRQNTAIGNSAMYLTTSGSLNTAAGYWALRSNQFGNENSAFGAYALHRNLASNNTAFGAYSLSNNERGSWNTAVGDRALSFNLASYNTAVGSGALSENVGGSGNTAVGALALRYNQRYLGNTAVGAGALQNPGGNDNTALGYQSLGFAVLVNNNTGIGAYTLYQAAGSFNTAIGTRGLFSLRTGQRNVAVGNSALSGIRTGSNNVAVGVMAGPQLESTNCTFIGYNTTSSNTSFSNSTAIGAQTIITGSNQVRVGNGSVTSIGGRVAWSTISDGRVKEEIKEDVPGLELINKLRPVTYTVNVQKLYKLIGRDSLAEGVNDQTRQTGFIAQEVAKAARELNFEFSGVDKPKNDQDLYGLRYAEFVVPLVKAVQELNELIKKQQSEIDDLVNLVDPGTGKPGAWIKQNTPNPVSSSTTIEYFIPNEVRAARILVTNAKGQQLKIYNVAGSGTVQFSVGTLPAGTYTYSLVADGRTISAKKLVVVLR